MTPLPVRFTNRWGGRRARPSYQDAVCWHLLLGGHAGVRAAAEGAQRRLERFGGLHMTPPQWLHVTVMRVGHADGITRSDMDEMLARAQAALARIPPVSVTLGRVLYAPEGIALSVSPAAAVVPVLAAAQAATGEVTGMGGSGSDAWTPHMTLCYSTAEQAAAPVIAELGKAIAPCKVTIDQMSLVIQDGPEQLWDWRVAGTVRMEAEAADCGTRKRDDV